MSKVKFEGISEELMSFHDALDRSSEHDGAIRIVTVTSGEVEQTRRNLRAVLREAAQALNAARAPTRPVEEGIREAMAKIVDPGAWRLATFERMERRKAALVTVEELLALLHDKPSEGVWLPIESAPRDGTRVLGFARQGIHPGDWAVICWNGSSFVGDGIAGPTHWQPLPAAPGQAPTPPAMVVPDELRGLSEADLERLAYEAMLWAKANNIGADQPSLVFARRFNFIVRKHLDRLIASRSQGGEA